MYAYPVLCVYTAPILDANDSHLDLASHLRKGLSCIGVLRVLICSIWSRSINTLSLVLSLVYPMCSPYLSLMTLGQHGIGFPFISFSNCGYKIKRLLGFVPIVFLFFFAIISLHSIRMCLLNRC